ncbi:MAG: hypothetical protein HYT27_02235 [Parcubacteria group bacterium]|nr:hypothetical protein [Parcubacteria group bacterium]
MGKLRFPDPVPIFSFRILRIENKKIWDLVYKIVVRSCMNATRDTSNLITISDIPHKITNGARIAPDIMPKITSHIPDDDFCGLRITEPSLTI